MFDSEHPYTGLLFAPSDLGSTVRVVFWWRACSFARIAGSKKAEFFPFEAFLLVVGAFDDSSACLGCWTAKFVLLHDSGCFLTRPHRREAKLAVSDELASWVCIREALNPVFKGCGRAAVSVWLSMNVSGSAWPFWFSVPLSLTSLSRLTSFPFHSRLHMPQPPWYRFWGETHRCRALLELPSLHSYWMSYFLIYLVFLYPHEEVYKLFFTLSIPGTLQLCFCVQLHESMAHP